MIYRTMLKSKIHRATVTDADVNYVGSITIDESIMEAADIMEHEQVHVLDLSNGSRLETYVIAGARDSGHICINGAAARLVDKGDLVIIVSYAAVDNDSASSYRSKVVLVDEGNRIKSINEKGEAFDLC